MALFGRDPERLAVKAAAKQRTDAEAVRLMSIDLDELAAEALPAFGEGGAKQARSGLGALMVANWIMTDYRGTGYLKELTPRIREAISRLQVAGLVVLQPQSERYFISEAGRRALQEGSTSDYLAGRLRA